MTTHVNAATERNPGEAEIRTWEDLRASGLLWLINRQVFHPRGFALAVVQCDGQIVGWRLLGHGREPWAFSGSEDEWFAAAQATLAALPVPPAPIARQQDAPIPVQRITYPVPLADGACEACGKPLRYNLSADVIRHADPTQDDLCVKPFPAIPQPQEAPDGQ